MDKLLLLCTSYLMSREVHFFICTPTGWILKATGDSWELRPLKAVCGCLSHEPILCLWGFLCISDAGCRDDKITALSNHLMFSTVQKSVQKKTQIRIHFMQLAHN